MGSSIEETLFRTLMRWVFVFSNYCRIDPDIS